MYGCPDPIEQEEWDFETPTSAILYSIMIQMKMTWNFEVETEAGVVVPLAASNYLYLQMSRTFPTATVICSAILFFLLEPVEAHRRILTSCPLLASLTAQIFKEYYLCFRSPPLLKTITNWQTYFTMLHVIFIPDNIALVGLSKVLVPHTNIPKYVLNWIPKGLERKDATGLLRELSHPSTNNIHNGYWNTTTTTGAISPSSAAKKLLLIQRKGRNNCSS